MASLTRTYRRQAIRNTFAELLGHYKKYVTHVQWENNVGLGIQKKPKSLRQWLGLEK